MLSNTHTPLIAHTADDSLTIYTGLYGDRHGQPVSNSYKTYNPDGSTDPAGSFAYWTSPVFDTAKPAPTAGHDNTPTMAYSATVPARPNTTGRQTPAPWVPFTRAGCSVGDFSTANMVLENTALDLADGVRCRFTRGGAVPGRPRRRSRTRRPPTTSASPCTARSGDATCTNAQAVKYGTTTPAPSAVPDSLPTEPGGYTGYQALFGHKYVAPQLGQGTANLTRNGYPVTDASGNLTDLNGNALDQLVREQAGIPGFQPDRDAVPGLPGRHAGERHPRHLRVHLRPA